MNIKIMIPNNGWRMVIQTKTYVQDYAYRLMFKIYGMSFRTLYPIVLLISFVGLEICGLTQSYVGHTTNYSDLIEYTLRIKAIKINQNVSKTLTPKILYYPSILDSHRESLKPTM